MEKRYILAIGLMIIVMVSWSIFFGPRPHEQTPEGEQESTPTSPSESTIETPTPTQRDESSLYFSRAQESPRTLVQTDNYEISFVEEHAIVQEWRLRKYPNRSGNNESINLIPESAYSCLLVDFPERLRNDTMSAVWKADKQQVILTDKSQDTLTFKTQIGDNLNVSKEFTFYQDRYFVDLALTIENLSNQPLEKYQLYWGPGINADLLRHEQKHSGKGRRASKNEGAVAYLGHGKPKQDLSEAEKTAPVLWAGLNSKYFAALMIPGPSLNAEYQREILTDNGENPSAEIAASTDAASLIIPGISVNERRTDVFRIYVGPKEDSVLNRVTHPGAPDEPLRMSKIIDLGFLWPVAWAMLWLLRGLNRIIGNYGIAIILLTLFTKLAAYPLIRKSYKSMKEMQELQPLLAELKEKYRDDPQKLNRATMRLYKEHGVNPLGGCIPWIPQLPILWALFTVFGNAVELRGAAFCLWMDDLSGPDTLFSLPFTIPLILTQIDAVRFLPIIYGVTTLLQQKMNAGMTPIADNTQAKIMQFLPFIFVFVLYNWSSGLILYWTCSNIFEIGRHFLTQLRKSDETEPIKTLSSGKQSQLTKRKSQLQKRRS